MKTKLYTALIAAALSSGVAMSADSSDKSFGEKTSETLGHMKDKTVEAGKVIGDDTKKAASSVKNAVMPDKDARKIDVTLTEHHIQMDREVPAGKTAFVVRNDGKERQNFKIEGNGLDKEFMIAVAPNDTKTMNVDLKHGDYKVFVPMPNHDSAAKGNEVMLKVK